MQIMSEKYEEKMLKAFIGKSDFDRDTYFWYLEAFKPYRDDNTTSAKWKWSWWGFFLGFFFLAYRKAYMASIIVLIITLVLSLLIPYGEIIIAIFTGGYSNYFIYNVYLAKKLKIEKLVSDEGERIEIMRKRGGYNRWIIFLPLGILSAAIIISMLAS